MKYFLSILLVSGTASGATTFPLTLSHEGGGSVTFQKVPQRVVTLSEEQAELLAVLGIKAVGFASGRVEEGTTGQKVQKLSTLARPILKDAIYIGKSDKPSQELLLQLKPDLILSVAGDYYRDVNTTLNKFAPTLSYDYDKNPWRNALLDMGKLFGKTAQAERYLKTYDARLLKLKTDLAPVARTKPNTTLLYMYEPQTIGVLGRSFGFSKNLTNLGLTLNAPAGIDPNISYKVLSTEELLNLKTDRVIILRRIVGGKMVPKNATDVALAKLGKPVLTYPLDPQEASGGPLTDLKRAEGLARLIKGEK